MDAAFSVFRKMDATPAVAIHGQVLTKPHIVELMLDLAGYTGQRSTRLLDPGCGKGAFTIAAAVRLIRSSGVPKSLGDIAECIQGIEKDTSAAAICRERLSLTLASE